MVYLICSLVFLYVLFAYIFSKCFRIFYGRKGRYAIIDGLHYCVYWPYYLVCVIRGIMGKDL